MTHPSPLPPSRTPVHLIPLLVRSQTVPTLWSSLDATVQQQLAHCLCDLMRRMTAVASSEAKENGHDRDTHRT